MGRAERAVWRLLWFLGCIVIGSSAGRKWQKEDKSITCYDCNSLYDPRCADPFDPYSLGYVNCSLRDIPEHLKDKYSRSVLCRKTIQKVQGQMRVIRGCGYVPDARDNKECIRRTGTHDVIVHYCSCTKSFCNTAHPLSRSSYKLIVAVTLITLALSCLG